MTGRTDLATLWEATDPAATLQARFGFADVDRAVSWLAEVAADHWSLRVERCDRVVLSASSLLAWLRVDGRCVVAKCGVDPTRHARLAAADAVVTWLEGRGFPVASPVLTPDGRCRVERDGFSIGLQPRVVGALLDVRDATQVDRAGRTLATLHTLLATYPGTVGGVPVPAGEQVVHGDFRSANILDDGARITAVLDFDEVAVRARVADLAQAAVLLGTRYHDWEPTTPAVRSVFVAAYDAVSPLTDRERDELERGIAAVAGRFGWR